MRRHTLAVGDHLVVIGFGPVAVRLVDDLLPEVAAGRVRVTVLGAESRAAYNRVLLGEYAVRRAHEDDLALVDADRWAEAGVVVRLGADARWIDRAARTVHVDQAGQSTEVPYDILVLAVGARANIPVLRGINPHPDAVRHLPLGVSPLRSHAEAAELRDVVARRGRVVVLGGGVLGLELALAAHEEGCAVTVVHHRPWLLTRSTDSPGGAMLGGDLARRGVVVVADAVAREVRLDDAGRFRALVLASGQCLNADVLVLACGTTPRTRIAEGAGLRVERGIVVNHDLEADHEARVFAIGDCAEVLCADRTCTVCPPRIGRGPAGLIGPGWQQASWLARRFTHELRREQEPLEPLSSIEPDTIRLKSRSVAFAAGGEIEGEPWATQPLGRRVAQWADGDGRYAKMVVRDGRLTGFAVLGMPRTAAELALAYANGRTLPEDLSVLFRLDGPEPDSAEIPLTATATVCRCAGVPAGSIRSAIAAGHRTVDEVRSATRAGSGCGGCHGIVRRLLAES